MPVEPVAPVIVSQERLDALFLKAQSSFRNWIDDSSKALNTSLEINKQVSAFYERLLLLDTGTIGVSVSGLLSFGTKAATLGHTKYFIVVIVAVAWLLLFLSIVLSRAVMTDVLIANQKLSRVWLRNSIDLNSSIIRGNIARLSTTMRGTVEVDGKHVDITTHFNEISRLIKEKFEESKKVIVTEASDDGVANHDNEKGQRAIIYMQLGLVLLGVAAVTLLVKL